ncbi:MAG: bifunctional phosphopantothenoylcysteine decarboxylase/phosphopantothenate--cysteine ligase CoaBC [bacterium]|nr:bifunctional phosphopantothenoylcysteine decarboxylase/phosphopantothenate--cysteine ligase CoaBC [bacterium]
MKSNRRPDRDARPAGDLGGRRILLGVTGGIAAYKAVEVARLFMQAGAKVQVVMTAAATNFVAPLTFETVTGRSVYVEMFPERGKESPWHTELSSWAEVVVVAPATADHIGRIACGLGDDLLTTTLLAYERRKVVCPSMNPRMWANPAVQENLNTLRKRGYRIIPPEIGDMARPGEEQGMGRLAEPETIYGEVHHLLSAPQDLRGVKVLVTGGRTEESWDPVRVLTNRASGRMGFALAEEARERGADVSLISGPSEVIPPSGVRLTRITTARQMAEAVKREFGYCNILLMSAAVSDYTFDHTAKNKIKKGDPDPEINLIPTEDILKGISQNKGNRVIVGFALETENVLDNALRKIARRSILTSSLPTIHLQKAAVFR